MVMLVRLGMVVTAVFGIVLGQIVMMEVEEPLQEKHHEKTTQHPCHGSVNRMGLFDGVRNQVQQRHAEHETGDKADGGLQARVRQAHEHGQPSPGQRGDQYDRRVGDQQSDRGIHARDYD